MVRQIARSKGYIDVDADRRGQNLARATGITHKWLSFARDGIEPTCFLYATTMPKAICFMSECH